MAARDAVLSHMRVRSTRCCNKYVSSNGARLQPHFPGDNPAHRLFTDNQLYASAPRKRTAPCESKTSSRRTTRPPVSASQLPDTQHKERHTERQTTPTAAARSGVPRSAARPLSFAVRLHFRHHACVPFLTHLAPASPRRFLRCMRCRATAN